MGGEEERVIGGENPLFNGGGGEEVDEVVALQVREMVLRILWRLSELDEMRAEVGRKRGAMRGRDNG